VENNVGARQGKAHGDKAGATQKQREGAEHRAMPMCARKEHTKEAQVRAKLVNKAQLRARPHPHPARG